MNNDIFFDIAIFAGLGIIPLFAGALKDYSSHGIIRILARFLVPTISAVAITSFVMLSHSEMLSSTFGIEFMPEEDFDNSSNEYAIIILVAIISFVLLWLLFYKLISFGERIGRQEDTGLQSDGTKITQQVNHIITPTLDEFTEKIQNNSEENLKSFKSELIDIIIPEINKIAKNQQTIQEKIAIFNANEEQRGLHQDVHDGHIIQLIDNQKNQNDILKTVKEWIGQNPNTYEILLSRTEAINYAVAQSKNRNSSYNEVKNTTNNDDSNTSYSSAKLTTFDGIANRSIGHKNQQEMAEFLRQKGFEIDDGHGAGQPDFIIKKKKVIKSIDEKGYNEMLIEDGGFEIVAVGSNKSFTLKDQSGRKQRKIYANDCMPEIILAKKLEIPMIIFVTNRNNKRRWAKKISYDDLENNENDDKEWEGISTPLVLAQADPESADKLEEDFLTTLSSIGGNV